MHVRRGVDASSCASIGLNTPSLGSHADVPTDGRQPNPSNPGLTCALLNAGGGITARKWSGEISTSSAKSSRPSQSSGSRAGGLVPSASRTPQNHWKRTSASCSVTWSWWLIHSSCARYGTGALEDRGGLRAGDSCPGIVLEHREHRDHRCGSAVVHQKLRSLMMTTRPVSSSVFCSFFFTGCK